ncbi:MAG: hypothetical protein JO269_03675 [Burkholderiaceae bacterium]|nr:hypothetical protein [Burkholderiaceae bacterium]
MSHSSLFSRLTHHWTQRKQLASFSSMEGDDEAVLQETEEETEAGAQGGIVRIPEDIYIQCGELRLSLVGIRK